jgi:hypothetical protein
MDELRAGLEGEDDVLEVVVEEHGQQEQVNEDLQRILSKVCSPYALTIFEKFFKNFVLISLSQIETEKTKAKARALRFGLEFSDDVFKPVFFSAHFIFFVADSLDSTPYFVFELPGLDFDQRRV